MLRKRVAATFLLLASTGVLWIAGCATVAGPREVEVPIARLQEGLAKKFPISQRYLSLVDITATNPRVQIQVESNRLTATVDAAITPVFMPRRLSGSFTVSGVLAVDPQRHMVVLRETRTDKLTLDGVDPLLTSQLAKVSDLVAQRLLNDVALTTFDPAQFRTAGVQYYPTRIRTAPQGLVVTFEPIK